MEREYIRNETYNHLITLWTSGVRDYHTMLSDYLTANSIFVEGYLTTPGQQAEEARAKRRIGLGFTGLGDALIMLKLRYDSDGARDMAARISEYMRDRAYQYSVELARERKKSIVKLVFFADAGGAWDRVKDVSGRVGTGIRDIKTDVGVGLRFVTPAFPIRLDYGYGLNHRPGERLYQINFGLGPLF